MSAKVIAPFALGAMVLAGLIGLMFKTPPGAATTRKWAGLAAAVAVFVLAILFINAAMFAQSNLSTSPALSAKLGEIDAIMAQHARPDRLRVAHDLAMSEKAADWRNRLNFRVLELAAQAPGNFDFTPADTAILESIFTERFGPLVDSKGAINCIGLSAGIMINKSSPAEVVDVFQSYSTAEANCNGRYRYLEEALRACKDKTSRWNPRCTEDLPAKRLATLGSPPDPVTRYYKGPYDALIDELLQLTQSAQPAK